MRNVFLALLAVTFVLLASSNLASAQQKRIYIANDDHTDYMWSGDEQQYQDWFIQMLEYYMAQIDSTASETNPDVRSKFNVDGNFWMWVYEHPVTTSGWRQPSRTFDALMNNYVRSAKITMPLNTLILLYGAMPAEAVLRSMYYAGQLERRYNTRFSLVVPQENQTLPAGVAGLWAGSGAEFGWKGICHCATRINAANRPREIYNFKGQDGSSILMKWNGRHNDGAFNPDYGLGGYLEAAYDSRANPHPGLQANYLFNNTGSGSAWWPWDVSAAFGAGGDNTYTLTSAFVDAARSNTLNARVIVSNEIDFFSDFRSTYGAISSGSLAIPSFSGAFGNEWDLYVASLGEVAADFKRHVEKLRGAEVLASVASLYNAGFMNGRSAARDKAFINTGLFYEHDWTADGPVSRALRATWQRRMRDEFVAYVNQLYTDALSAVGALSPAVPSSTRFIVFNPLSWGRNDFADFTYNPGGAFHVVDLSSGLEVPSQLIGSGSSSVVRILASAVPSIGYKVFEIRSGAGTIYSPAANINGATIDNGIYAVTLAGDGSLSSVIDHTDSERHLEQSGQKIHSLGSGSGAVSTESSGAVSATLVVNAGGSPAHRTRVTLYRNIDRIDVEGGITQNFGGSSSYAVAYDSKFNLSNPIIRHEEVGSILRVGRLGGSHPQDARGGDYANENTRTDYLSFNHFVDLSEAARGITMSNWDSIFFQAGSSTPTSLDQSSSSIKAVVGMQPDGTGLGIGNQGGDTNFLNRYAIFAHAAYDAGTSMRFALEHQNPLVATRVTGNSSAPLTSMNGSFLTINSPDTVLWALKPAEEGIAQGLIARVWNIADVSRSMQLSLPVRGITQARKTTHLETDLSTLALSSGVLNDSLNRQQLKTYRVFPGSGTTPDTMAPQQPSNLTVLN